MKVYFAEDLKVADIRHGIGSDVLRMELEKVQNVPKEFRAGWREAPVHMVSKNDDFAIFRLRFFPARVRSMVMHDTLCG